MQFLEAGDAAGKGFCCAALLLLLLLTRGAEAGGFGRGCCDPSGAVGGEVARQKFGGGRKTEDKDSLRQIVRKGNRNLN